MNASILNYVIYHKNLIIMSLMLAGVEYQSAESEEACVHMYD